MAQEVTNDVFVKIWNNSETYDESKGRFFTWVLNIARNAAIDVLRSKSFKQDKLTLSFDSAIYDFLSQKEEVVVIDD